MAKFRKKPIEIIAIRTPTEMYVKTKHGTVKAEPGDWIITGLDGEQYPCKDKVFRKLYEPVDESSEILFGSREES